MPAVYRKPFIPNRSYRKAWIGTSSVRQSIPLRVSHRRQRDLQSRKNVTVSRLWVGTQRVSSLATVPAIGPSQRQLKLRVVAKWRLWIGTKRTSLPAIVPTIASPRRRLQLRNVASVRRWIGTKRTSLATVPAIVRSRRQLQARNVARGKLWIGTKRISFLLVSPVVRLQRQLKLRVVAKWRLWIGTKIAAVVAPVTPVIPRPDFLSLGETLHGIGLVRPLPRVPLVHETSVRFTAETSGKASAVIIRKLDVGGVASAHLVTTVHPCVVHIQRASARFQVSPIDVVYAETDYEEEDLLLLGLTESELMR